MLVEPFTGINFSSRLMTFIHAIEILQMKKSVLAIAVTLTTVSAFVLGCLASDEATRTGFPHKSYVIEIPFTPTAEEAWHCARMGTSYGANFSIFDYEAGHQQDCTLLVTGDLNPDGSLDVYLGAHTWELRWLERGFPPHRFMPSDIHSIKPAD